MANQGSPNRSSGLLALWFGLGAGPIAWGFHLIGSYVLVPFSCSLGTVLPIHLLTLVTGIITLASAIIAFIAWRRSGTDLEADLGAESDLDRPAARSGFMALSGVLLSGLFLLLILAEGTGPFFLPPCERRGGELGLIVQPASIVQVSHENWGSKLGQPGDVISRSDRTANRGISGGVVPWSPPSRPLPTGI